MSVLEFIWEVFTSILCLGMPEKEVHKACDKEVARKAEKFNDLTKF